MLSNGVFKDKDLIVISTKGEFELERLFSPSVAQRVIQKTSVPVSLLRPTDDWTSRYSEFRRMIVALDGSPEAESVLPTVDFLAAEFDGEVLLVPVPEGEESETLAATMQQYLANIVAALESPKTRMKVLQGGSGPARTILQLAESERADIIVMATHGRGGATRREHLPLGSVPTRVIQQTKCPVLLVPARLIEPDEPE